MISRRAYWSLKYFNAFLANSNGNIGPMLRGYDQPRRQYSSDPKTPEPGACCKDNPQTKGREVEPWPKADPPPVPWRCECPQQPQPVNYDPYRIRVPETVVPPLTPSNVKEIPCEDNGPILGSAIKDLFHNSPIVHPDYWRDKPERKVNSAPDVSPKLGYHGRTKYKYAFHEPWKPLDRLSLLEKAEEEEVKQSTEAAAAEQNDKQTVR